MNTKEFATTDCRVCAAIRACRSGIWAVAVFSFCENLLMLAAPLYMMQVYDRVLASRSFETLVYLTLALAFALLMLSVLDLARGRLLARMALWLDQRLAPGLFERAIQSRLRGRNYGPEAFGDLASLRGFITSPGMTALFDLPWSVIFVAAAFLLHPYLGYLAIGAAALLFGLALLGEFISHKPIQMAAEGGMLSRRHLEATARNAEVIEAMGMMGAVSGHWIGRNAQLLGLQGTVLSRSTLFTSTTKFIRLLVQSLGLGLGAWLVLTEQATGGVMIAASILLTRAVGPIEHAIGAWKSLVTVRASVRRLKAFAMEPAYRPTAMLMPPPKGALSVEGLIYRTPDPFVPPILKGISFQLTPGEAVAVIGPSGAGKSTLARLLIGAIPSIAGLVRLDGADIFTWDRADIGQHVGYLPQDVELFAGSVSDNIARMGKADPNAIVAAARIAGVHDLILRLPRGYETEIGEGGQHLSGGQRQRIALARAVLGNPRLVVLDEPNSNLDGDGEIALVRAIEALKQAGSTVVIVTHRTSLMQHVDKVLLLRDGQVEAFGPRQEVFARLVGQSAPTPAAPEAVSVTPGAARVRPGDTLAAAAGQPKTMVTQTLGA
ncbi:type I secretion system permease/ATPase [Microvirga arabica]|uniref:type I secretion system permease/ATPase n=1 Tax=Microvirga arabica TaxID=1128671 RepID=UPI00193A6C55|nr:type I secretion system permease/ATPase [Microvirga arabica]MBM1174716.1 type I secretion system permease/ATPase [Microvirga arabica]